jgi:hypothetical protein
MENWKDLFLQIFEENHELQKQTTELIKINKEKSNKK